MTTIHFVYHVNLVISSHLFLLHANLRGSPRLQLIFSVNSIACVNFEFTVQDANENTTNHPSRSGSSNEINKRFESHWIEVVKEGRMEFCSIEKSITGHSHRFQFIFHFTCRSLSSLTMSATRLLLTHH